MAEIHRRIEKLRAPLRLEERRVPPALFAPAIFIAVKDFSGGRAENCACDFIQRKGRQQVVVIEAGDELASGEFESSIRVFCDSEVRLEALEADPWLAWDPPVEDLDCFGLGRTGIDQTKLPVPVRLFRNGRKHCLKELRRRVEDRHKQTDFRFASPKFRLSALTLQRRRVRFMFRYPRRISSRSAGCRR